jgi:hypothetical protein
MLRTASVLFFGSLTLMACAQTVAREQYLQTALGPKAAFDLSCPVEQLQFANLGPGTERLLDDGKNNVLVKDLADQQGVIGCGKRGRYVLVDGHWVLNAGSDDTQGAKSSPEAK